jgi:hypothetical protein
MADQMPARDGSELLDLLLRFLHTILSEDRRPASPLLIARVVVSSPLQVDGRRISPRASRQLICQYHLDVVQRSTYLGTLDTTWIRETENALQRKLKLVDKMITKVYRNFAFCILQFVFCIV